MLTQNRERTFQHNYKDRHRIHEILQHNHDHILVCAHRGDWRNYPENSLEGIQNALELGSHIIEIDIQRSADGVFFLMHDRTLNRTTTGSGLLSELRAENIEQCRLKNGLNYPTNYKVPRLQEVLELAQRHNCVIYIDKAFPYIDEVYPLLLSTRTVEQVLIKIPQIPDAKNLIPETRKRYPGPLFLASINTAQNSVEGYMDHLIAVEKPDAIELLFSEKTTEIASIFAKKIKQSRIRVFVNTMRTLCGPYHDENIQQEPHIIQTLAQNGFSIIQTDRPKLILKHVSDIYYH